MTVTTTATTCRLDAPTALPCMAGRVGRAHRPSAVRCRPLGLSAVAAATLHRVVERPLERRLRSSRQPRLNAEAPPLAAEAR
jgi:peptidoglycan/LPS O-acetylase OafA/YrhL